MTGPALLLNRQRDFVVALRTAGLRISVAEGLDAVRAMTRIELVDRAQLRAALAAALVKRQQHRPAFDALFDLYYPPVTGASSAPPSDVEAPHRDPDAAPRGPLEDTDRDRFRADLSRFLLDGDERRLDGLARDAVQGFGSVPARGGGTSFSALSALQRVSADTLMAGVLEQVLSGAARGGLDERRARTMIRSRIDRFEGRVRADVARRLAEQGDVDQVARRAVRPSVDQVAFLSATRAELADLRREVVPLARRLATRLTLDQRRGRRGTIDLRATMRESLSSGGVPMTTRHRPRRPNRTDLVVLCDLSESVSSFAHFTLLLVYALREQFSRVRAFGFVDELDELTRFFRPGADVLDTVTRLTAEADVTWVTGRTDYGRALTLFAHRFPDAVGPRTALLVLGDARSNYGDLALPALAGVVDRARHAYWLNPERRGQWDTGDSRASEFAEVVPMRECRNLAQLAEFVTELAPR